MPENDDLRFRTRRATEELALVRLAKRNQNAYVASTRASVPVDATVNLHLANPTGSGLNANVATVFARTQFEGIVDVHDAFSSAPSGGTANGVDNLLLDSGDTNGATSMNVAKNVTFTASNTHIKDVIPSGGPGGQVGGEATETEPLIEPGREIVADVTNESGSEAKAAVVIVFVEEQREE